jgi:hypothetical protein
VLADLKTKMSDAEAQAKMNAACKSRVRAADLHFSAFDYLPIVDEAISASTKPEPDWESIMVNRQPLIGHEMIC